MVGSNHLAYSAMKIVFLVAMLAGVAGLGWFWHSGAVAAQAVLSCRHEGQLYFHGETICTDGLRHWCNSATGVWIKTEEHCER